MECQATCSGTVKRAPCGCKRSYVLLLDMVAEHNIIIKRDLSENKQRDYEIYHLKI